MAEVAHKRSLPTLPAANASSILFRLSAAVATVPTDSKVDTGSRAADPGLGTLQRQFETGDRGIEVSQSTPLSGTDGTVDGKRVDTKPTREERTNRCAHSNARSQTTRAGL